MDKEQDYASDTDESDEDFCPENLAGESSASEEEDDRETNDELNEDTENVEKKPVKRKDVTKKVNRKKVIARHVDESDDEDIYTSKRTTRQRDDTETNGKGKLSEKDELISDEEDKSRTNALWADFLKDVNLPENVTKVHSSNVGNNCSSRNGSEASAKVRNEEQSKTSADAKSEKEKLTIIETVDFAGEAVSIEREIDASSIKENKAATIPAAKKQPFSRIMPGAGMKRPITTTGAGPANGLGSILNQLGKKKKLSVLEKSQMDWKSFKQSEGIDEQLQTFNKGKDGYLERQDFLQRTDVRQFEIEKNLRQTTRRPY